MSTYFEMPDWGKCIGFRTSSQSKYVVWENQRAMRAKCYPDGHFEFMYPSSLTVFCVEEDVMKAMSNYQRKEFVTIKVKEILPHGGLVPFEIFQRVEYSFDQSKMELTIKNPQVLENGKDFHIGHKIEGESLKLFRGGFGKSWEEIRFKTY